MAGKGDGEGEGNILRLENQIAVLKYVLLFTNVLEWILGAAVFVLCLWLRFESGINEWLTILNALNFYIGVYILMIIAAIIMVVAVLGCMSALQENSVVLFAYIGAEAFSFILLLAGSAVLLDNSVRDSHFQPRVRESMRQLIMNAQYEPARNTLAMIQEGIACCGADGPDDYLTLQQPIPTECRDTVTGNPFFHGCVDELTWFFEAKCAWIAALAMLMAFISVMNAVVSIILIQALKKEEEEADTYRK
ncbi:tetraspanin-2A [Anthonomus grandis grandis]|uniref:tetraspanin-2A n=1 Tax=Anthonomus grandis grandis TaxID=2921223 RepID=UPI002165CF2A|nr:tetraspanin-2A [Anthonomus grandis grandis]